ncbi:hypothetical protein SARC_00130 [Sphaeroforma arctica JP610]|uniref:mRNA m(6)A methyltransferase n=1 Tax=Sphaeroforma arctica JP610 TaxID=667725 RepID=A0A0L0GHE1_9EUKA|nr:hypothetical protein SARC_00130 [Sphaeroforma arctica JP610]KNC87758.1 hypothetical protein SARC_00130 [Sphaeroforma arctica JP610]|eukprot:XP_014161660.1 hypothetical protein SARC_00130 [Sphaeroforma arctica JP610]
MLGSVADDTKEMDSYSDDNELSSCDASDSSEEEPELASDVDELIDEEIRTVQEMVLSKRKIKALKKARRVLTEDEVVTEESTTLCELNSGLSKEELLASRSARRVLRRNHEAKRDQTAEDETNLHNSNEPHATNNGAVATAENADVAGSCSESKKTSDSKSSTQNFTPPPFSVPISADVTSYDFKSLAQLTKFDVIHMDPPWRLANAKPTRGVALGYSQLCDNDIADMPVECLSDSGFIFIWVINNRFEVGLELMTKWGYKFVDNVDWVKQTVNRRLAKSHGYYLQHAKETCLVGFKGDLNYVKSTTHTDVIFAPRRGQSQKPEEIYHLIEALVPNGKYLEIFARKNNLRDYWVSIGNEL